MTRRSSPRLAQVSLSSPPAAAGRTAGRRPTSGPRPARRPRGAGSRRRTRPPQPRHTRPRAAQSDAGTGGRVRRGFLACGGLPRPRFGSSHPAGFGIFRRGEQRTVPCGRGEGRSCGHGGRVQEPCRRRDGRLGTSSVCCGIRRRFRREPVCIDGRNLLHRRALGSDCQSGRATTLGRGHPGAHVCIVGGNTSATDHQYPRSGWVAGTGPGRCLDRRRSPGGRVNWQGTPSNDDSGLDSIRSYRRRPVPGGSRRRGRSVITEGEEALRAV